MSRFLAYVDPVPGRLYPLVDTLLELSRRGHHVAVRAGAADVPVLEAAGLSAAPLGGELRELVPADWRARTRFGALVVGLRQFGGRAELEVADLRSAMAAEQPDALLVDEAAWGAATAAEASGLPWAYCLVSPVPIPSRDAPPFGLGLAPRHDHLGRLRDALVAPLTLGVLARVIASHANPLRVRAGLSPLHTVRGFYLAAPLVLCYTAEPFEYPRTDWPEQVRLVGPGLWEPPATAPGWLPALQRPLVLVTCSTLFQDDGRLAEVCCKAFAGQPYDVVLTTGDVDASAMTVPPNVRVERYVPHSLVLPRAACLVCHAGMGVTQKALSYGVPVVAVPFGRDQPEVARRVEVARVGVRLSPRRLDAGSLLAAVQGAIARRTAAQHLAAQLAAAGGRTAAADALEALVPLAHRRG